MTSFAKRRVNSFQEELIYVPFSFQLSGTSGTGVSASNGGYPMPFQVWRTGSGSLTLEVTSSQDVRYVSHGCQLHLSQSTANRFAYAINMTAPTGSWMRSIIQITSGTGGAVDLAPHADNKVTGFVVFSLSSVKSGSTQLR